MTIKPIYDVLLEDLRMKDRSGGNVIDLGVTFQGEYSNATAYTVGQSVSYAGLLFVCIQDGTGQQPDTATTYWGNITNKGEQGIQGPAGGGSVTGWLEDGQVTINADDTLVDISSGKVIIVSGTDNPIEKIISWPTQVGINPNLVTRTAWVGVKDDGSGEAEFVFDTHFDSVERRTTAIIGKIRSNTVDGHLTHIDDFERPAWGILTAFQDFILEFGSINLGGHEITAASGMQVNISEGTSYRYHAEDTIGHENVHNDPAFTPRTAYAYTVNGSGAPVSRTTLDPDNYNLGGTKTAVENNKYTKQEIRIFPVSGSVYILYGDKQFKNLGEAEASPLPAIAGQLTKDLLDGSFPAGSIVMKKGVTNLAEAIAGGTASILSPTVGGGTGTSAFLALTDTPNSYTGQSGKVPLVNVSEDGLGFSDINSLSIVIFSSINFRFFGELGVPGLQGWTDAVTGSATIDTVTDNVFGLPKKVTRHNDDANDGITKSSNELSIQNWADIKEFGASYSGISRLDTTNGHSGFSASLASDINSNPLATGKKRYTLFFKKELETDYILLKKGPGSANGVSMDGNDGNPIVVFNEWFKWEVKIEPELGVSFVYVNDIKTTFEVSFSEYTSVEQSVVILSSGTTFGSNRITYHDNFGVTIYTELPEKMFTPAEMSSSVINVIIPEGRRDYRITIPDDNPRKLGDKIFILANNVGGIVSLHTENEANPQMLVNGFSNIQKFIPSVLSAIFTNIVDQNNIYVFTNVLFPGEGRNTTVRWNGQAWVESDVLQNDGTNIIIKGNLNGLDIRQNVNNSLVIGLGAGASLSGDSDNVIIGSGAADAATSMSKSVVIGKDAVGAGAYSGTGYVCIGHEAGNSLTVSQPGVLIGLGAGKSVTGRHSVVAIGAGAAQNAVCNAGNVYIGSNVGINSGGGANCIYIGNSVAAQNSGGADNVIIGTIAALSTQNLSGSVVIGRGALQSGNGTSADNVIIGDGAGKTLSSGGGNVMLGHDAGAQLTTESNQLVIANTNTLTPLIDGNFTEGSEKVTINGDFKVVGAVEVGEGTIDYGNVTHPPIQSTSQTGLDDVSVSGEYSLAGNAVFQLKIESVGDTDTFEWRKGSLGAYSPPVTLTGTDHMLQDGISVKWDTITGHTLNDTWEIHVGHELSSDLVLLANNGLIVKGDVVVTGNVRSLSAVKLLDGMRFINKESGESEFHLYVSGTDSSVDPLPTGFDGSLIFKTNVGNNPSQMNVVFWDGISTRPLLVINQGGANKASIFERSLVIGAQKGKKPLDGDYTIVNSDYDKLKFNTSGDGADLGVENNLQVLETIYTKSIGVGIALPIKTGPDSASISLGGGGCLVGAKADVDLDLLQNAYYNDGYRYLTSNADGASRLTLNKGNCTFYTAPSGDIDAEIVFTSQVEIDGESNTTTVYNDFDVAGNVKLSGVVEAADSEMLTVDADGRVHKQAVPDDPNTTRDSRLNYEVNTIIWEYTPYLLQVRFNGTNKKFEYKVGDSRYGVQTTATANKQGVLTSGFSMSLSKDDSGVAIDWTSFSTNATGVSLSFAPSSFTGYLNVDVSGFPDLAMKLDAIYSGGDVAYKAEAF